LILWRIIHQFDLSKKSCLNNIIDDIFISIIILVENYYRR
jgi:hypothetical protein